MIKNKDDEIKWKDTEIENARSKLNVLEQAISDLKIQNESDKESNKKLKSQLDEKITEIEQLNI